MPAHHSPWRWIVRLLIALPCGAVITLLLAWAAATRPPTNTFRGSLTTAFTPTPIALGGTTYAGSLWIFDDTYRLGERTISVMSLPTQTPPKSVTPRPSLPPEIDWFLDGTWSPNPKAPPMGNVSRITRIYGWPATCLWYGDAWNEPTSIAPGWSASRFGAWEYGRGPTSLPQALPLRVLWPSTAIDITFWTAVALALTSALSWFRRRRRIRLGLCTHCAYNTKSLPPDSPCPECGRPSAA